MNNFLRDQEEEEKRKNYIKDNKSMMREFLLNQMNEKRVNSNVDRKSDLAQADVWNI